LRVEMLYAFGKSSNDHRLIEPIIIIEQHRGLKPVAPSR